MAAEIVQLDYETANDVISRVRDADRVEFLYAAGGDMNGAIAEAMSLGKSWAAYVDGRPVAIYGIVRRSPLSDEGLPWLLASREVDRPDVRRVFLRYGKDELSRVSAGYRRLWGYVHGENRVAVRWLKWMGFRMVDTVNIGGAAFFRFEKDC